MGHEIYNCEYTGLSECCDNLCDTCHNNPNRKQVYKNWLHAEKDEIARMTYKEAKEIIQKQINLGHEGGEYCPRKHTVKAFEIILERAEKYTKIKKFMGDIL